jgi:capsular exopolysaccharide synthesis family protein
MLIIMTIVGFIVGGVLWYLLLSYFPKYTAQTYLEVLSPIDSDPMDIASPAAEKQIKYDYRMSIAALINQQSSLQKLIDSEKIQSLKWFEQFGDVTNERSDAIAKAYKELKKRFRVHPQRDGDFVVISMTCAKKDEAAEIVNEMVRLFMASRKRIKVDEILKQIASHKSQQGSVEDDLRAAEVALKQVGQTYNLTDLSGSETRQFRHTIEVKLDALATDYDRLILDVAQTQAVIVELDELATGPVGFQISRQVQADPIVTSLTQQIALQESALAGRLSRLGPGHRVVRQAQDLLDKLIKERESRRIEIGEEIRKAQLLNAHDQLRILEKRLEALFKQRDEVEKEKIQLDLARTAYAQREKIRDERQLMLDAIKEKIQKLELMRTSPDVPKVRSMGIAMTPLEVSSPRWEIYFPGGTILGLMLGVGLAFLIELLNDLVRSPRDVAKYLSVPLLGVIPEASEDVQVGDIDLYNVVRQAPYSMSSESYRQLRTNLKLSDRGKSMKVILVTSGIAGDGKTTTAANLATTLVAESKKVLLIDANFRRPGLQRVFPKTGVGGDVEHSEFGLSSLLMGLCSYNDARRADIIDGLDVIESGPLPSNPVELLGSYQMQQLIDNCRKSHDYVIIDTSPVLLVSDAKVLTGIVDGTLLVLNAGATRRGAAQRCIRELKEVNAPIVGCVLMAVRAMKGGYFREQFKSYQRYQQLQPA